MCPVFCFRMNFGHQPGAFTIHAGFRHAKTPISRLFQLPDWFIFYAVKPQSGDCDSLTDGNRKFFLVARAAVMRTCVTIG